MERELSTQFTMFSDDSVLQNFGGDFTGESHEVGRARSVTAIFSLFRLGGTHSFRLEASEDNSTWTPIPFTDLSMPSDVRAAGVSPNIIDSSVTSIAPTIVGVQSKARYVRGVFIDEVGGNGGSYFVAFMNGNYIDEPRPAQPGATP